MKRTVLIGSILTAAGVAALVQSGAPAEGPLTLCLTAVSSVRPDQLWRSWSFAPAVLVPLVAFASIYSGYLARKRVGMRRGGILVCGLLLLVIALVSPLCRLAATLASAHMVQHVILVALAPPLLVLADDGAGSRLPRLHPTYAAALYGMAIWLWHVPRFYEAALVNAEVHLAMYASLLIAAAIFWRSIVGVSIEQRTWAIPILLVTLLHTGLLGALLTLSPRIWFPLMSPGALLWSLTPLEDQQLAGLIMWVPMGAVYLLAALWSFGTFLSAVGRSAPPDIATE